MSEIKLLVIGGSGFIGQAVLKEFGPDAIGTYCERPFYNGVKFDLSCHSIKPIVEKYRPVYALILAGMTGIQRCAQFEEKSHFINVERTQNLMDELCKNGVIPIFASSDAVYGEAPFQKSSENEPTSPINTYGRQKLIAEQHLRRSHDHLIIRLSKVIDPDLHPSGLLGPWLNDFYNGVPVKAYADRFFTPVCLTDVVKWLKLLIDEKCNHGVFNFAGFEITSYFNMAFILWQATVTAHQHWKATIEPLSIAFDRGIERNPRNASMTNYRISRFSRSTHSPILAETAYKAVKNFIERNQNA